MTNYIPNVNVGQRVMVSPPWSDRDLIISIDEISDLGVYDDSGQLYFFGEIVRIFA